MINAFARFADLLCPGAVCPTRSLAIFLVMVAGLALLAIGTQAAGRGSDRAAAWGLSAGLLCFGVPLLVGLAVGGF